MPTSSEPLRDRQMLHLNGDAMCAVMIRTTGLIAGHNDLVQLCIMPLDSEFDVSKRVIPFALDLIPKRPENFDPEHSQVSFDQFNQIKEKGLHPWSAIDLFDEWIQKLHFKNRKGIAPLVYNWSFVRPFLLDWIGSDEAMKNSFKDINVRDVMTAANYSNDRADNFAESLPYPKQYLFRYLCSQVVVERIKGQDCVADCVSISRLYKKMLSGMY